MFWRKKKLARLNRDAPAAIQEINAMAAKLGIEGSDGLGPSIAAIIVDFVRQELDRRMPPKK